MPEASLMTPPSLLLLLLLLLAGSEFGGGASMPAAPWMRHTMLETSFLAE